ncbi:hypothetical protein [Sinanaerobacter sp. ZZT-01]|uniref:hypothetical protein n=1 Tax=Sinanaerobacter sp. ZZT-01 TaxID=3111540 RepID=UPI002D79BD8C|nr:hypothetical protein [Sinanaerobacter sp. ZZT-01]WRR93275.1 hypothetical protein U5921_14780 [Sinanaerobacter sp. ZZT-01]
MKKLVSLILMTVLMFSFTPIVFATDSDKNVKEALNTLSDEYTIEKVSEEEYCKHLAEDRGISLEEARLLNEEIIQSAYEQMPKTRAGNISFGKFKDHISNARVYKEFSYRNYGKAKIEVGAYVKVNAYGSARGFVSGSACDAYYYNKGIGVVDFEGVAHVDLLNTNAIEVSARGVYVYTIAWAISVNIPSSEYSISAGSNIYARSKTQDYSFIYNL